MGEQSADRHAQVLLRKAPRRKERKNWYRRYQMAATNTHERGVVKASFGASGRVSTGAAAPEGGRVQEADIEQRPRR
jgi:hypothetical protein